jgi:hypothetical protein
MRTTMTSLWCHVNTFLVSSALGQRTRQRVEAVEGAVVLLPR